MVESKSSLLVRHMLGYSFLGLMLGLTLNPICVFAGHSSLPPKAVGEIEKLF